MDAHLGGKPVFLKGGPRALLFIHGFTSTPQSLMLVAEKLAADGFTVDLPLLPGHGTTPEDMAKYSARDWMKAGLDAWDRLAERYPRPAVAGLSMGAALALHVAANRPVACVAALAPFLYIKDWRLPLVPLMQLLSPWTQGVANDIKDSPHREQAYTRYKVKHVEDLLTITRIVRSELSHLQAPLLGIQARDDHVVPPSCLDDLMKWAGSPVKEKIRLTNSYHVITLDQERMQVAEYISRFLAKHLLQ